MPTVDEKSLEVFRRWKEKHPDWEMLLAMRKNLREFKEKFSVDTASNFHCPWCFTGRLYTNEDKPDTFICRNCELQFHIICLQQEELDKMIERKRQERKEKREARRHCNKEIELLDTLTVEALQTKSITCQGCGQKIRPDTEYCTCGWKNPLVGLGDASDEDF